MSETAMTEIEPKQIQYFIQYDGLKRGEHSIDLADLGESLQGFSKILACVGHFIQTGQFNRRYGSLNVTVSTNASLEPGCIEIPVWIKEAAPQIFSGFAGSVFTAVVAYVISRRGKQEMEHLSNALKQSMAQNEALQIKLLATIDKLADGLVAANRQALSPIGRSCDSISILDGEKQSTGIFADKETKDFIDKEQEKEVSPESDYIGRISELDKLTGACKISLDGDQDDDRIACVITDPLLQTRGNGYVRSFADGTPIKFRAKAELNSDGCIIKMYISDIVSDQ